MSGQLSSRGAPIPLKQTRFLGGQSPPDMAVRLPSVAKTCDESVAAHDNDDEDVEVESTPAPRSAG